MIRNWFIKTELAHIRRDIRRLERRIYASYEDDNPCLSCDQAMLKVLRRYLARLADLAAQGIDLQGVQHICQYWLYQVQEQQQAAQEPCLELRSEQEYLSDLIERLREAAEAVPA
ncbi:MAG TPA: hypothetical protein VKY59_07500 [Spirillospora sp.]|nr:hypothetical protein [Spirillospora sp.]